MFGLSSSCVWPIIHTNGSQLRGGVSSFSLAYDCRQKLNQNTSVMTVIIHWMPFSVFFFLLSRILNKTFLTFGSQLIQQMTTCDGDNCPSISGTQPILESTLLLPLMEKEDTTMSTPPSTCISSTRPVEQGGRPCQLTTTAIQDANRGILRGPKHHEGKQPS